MSAIGQDQVRLLPVDHGADTRFAYMSAVEVLLNLSMGGTPSTQVLCEGFHRESRVHRAGNIESSSCGLQVDRGANAKPAAKSISLC